VSPFLWLAGGIVLAALEMAAAGVYLLWIGLGAIATGLVTLALPAMTLAQQLLLFALAVAVSAPLGALVYRRHARSAAPTLNRRGEQLVGRTVTLDEAIVNGAGRVRVGDTVWRVEGPDLPAGSRVRIIGSEGVALWVVGEPGPAP
jgi:membrane protein implicated in regulation of membrane protease activity